MSNEKYYTPEIEEFHVGFEYEALWGIENVDGEWLKETFSDKQSTNDLEDVIRVKHLDREDIESFGFEFKEPGLYEIGEIFSLFTEHDHDQLQVIIVRGTGEKVWRPHRKIFEGHIKNKSELARVLKQVGVI